MADERDASTTESSSKPPTPTLSEDVERIGTAAKIVALAITLPALPLHAIIEKLLGDEVVELWRVLAFTAPLSVAVAIIVIIATSTEIPAYIQGVMATGILLVATWIGGSFGLVPFGPKEIWERSSNWQGMLTDLVTRYAFLYGPGTFFNALLVGGFIGGVWWYLVIRRIDLERSKIANAVDDD